MGLMDEVAWVIATPYARFEQLTNLEGSPQMQSLCKDTQQQITFCGTKFAKLKHKKTQSYTCVCVCALAKYTHCRGRQGQRFVVQEIEWRTRRQHNLHLQVWHEDLEMNFNIVARFNI